MRVLITGATGLVGTALTEALLARGDEIVGLTRNADRARAKQPAVDWHEWQPPGGAGGGETPPVTAFEGVDAIVNLQGERIDQRWTDEAKRRIMESRRDATRVLAETVARLAEKPAVVVSGSAVGIYGDRGDDPVDENSATGLDLAAGRGGPAGGPAGSSDSAGFDTLVVGAWEQAAEGFGNVGVRLVNLRTGHVLDPSGGLLGRLLLPFRLGLGGPIAGGDQYLSWVHIDDEVGIILWALDTETVSGPINATAPDPASNRDFTKALGRALGRPALLPLPGVALDVMYGSEFAATIKGGQRVLPARAQELGYRFRHPDLDQALTALL